MNAHKGHNMVYVATSCVAETNCEITDDGNVRTTSSWLVTDIDGDTYVFCETCNVRLHAGEGGLSEEWYCV